MARAEYAINANDVGKAIEAVEAVKGLLRRLQLGEGGIFDHAVLLEESEHRRRLRHRNGRNGRNGMKGYKRDERRRA